MKKLLVLSLLTISLVSCSSKKNNAVQGQPGFNQNWSQGQVFPQNNFNQRNRFGFGLNNRQNREYSLPRKETLLYTCESNVLGNSTEIRNRVLYSFKKNGAKLKVFKRILDQSNRKVIFDRTIMNEKIGRRVDVYKEDFEMLTDERGNFSGLKVRIYDSGEEITVSQTYSGTQEVYCN